MLNNENVVEISLQISLYWKSHTLQEHSGDLNFIALTRLGTEKLELKSSPCCRYHQVKLVINSQCFEVSDSFVGSLIVHCLRHIMTEITFPTFTKIHMKFHFKLRIFEKIFMLSEIMSNFMGNSKENPQICICVRWLS